MLFTSGIPKQCNTSVRVKALNVVNNFVAM